MREAFEKEFQGTSAVMTRAAVMASRRSARACRFRHVKNKNASERITSAIVPRALSFDAWRNRISSGVARRGSARRIGLPWNERATGPPRVFEGGDKS